MIRLAENFNDIYEYAKEHPTSIIINAGLFNVDGTANGQVIINKKDKSLTSLVLDDQGKLISKYECYPLIINNGNLFCIDQNRFSYKNFPKYLCNYDYAVCGWGALYEDGIKNENFIINEWRHGKKIKSRQIIGQLKNKNYFIFTCEKASYRYIFKFLEKKEVDFAYSLDGGRSTKLIIGGKQLNKVAFFSKTARPKIPNFIEFIPQKKEN